MGTIVLSALITVLTGVAAVGYRYPKAAEEIIRYLAVTLLLVVLFQLAYKKGFKEANRAALDTFSFENFYAYVPEGRVNTDSIFLAHPDNTDTARDIIYHIFQRESYRVHENHIYIGFHNATYKKIVAAYKVEVKEVTRLTNYFIFALIALIPLYVFALLMEKHRKPNDEKLDDGSK